MMQEPNDTRYLILEVAKRKFERYGFRKTGMDEICTDLRISTKTLYDHFTSKEDLFLQLFINEAMKLRAYTLEETGSIDDPLEKLKRMTSSAVHYLEEEPFMVNVIRDEDNLFYPFIRVDYIKPFEEQVVTFLSAVIREGIEKKRFRQVDERIAGYLILKVFQASTYLKTLPLSENNDTGYEINAVLDFITHAIVNPET